MWTEQETLSFAKRLQATMEGERELLIRHTALQAALMARPTPFVWIDPAETLAFYAEQEGDLSKYNTRFHEITIHVPPYVTGFDRVLVAEQQLREALEHLP